MPDIVITETPPEGTSISTEPAEVAQIATAAETTVQAAEAAVALAQVQAAQVIADVTETIDELESNDQWQEQRIADLETAALALTTAIEQMNSQLFQISEQVAALTTAQILEPETETELIRSPESESESLEVTQESPVEVVAEPEPEKARPSVRLV